MSVLFCAMQWAAPTEDNVAYLQTIFRNAPPLTTAHIDGQAPDAASTVCHFAYFTQYNI